MAASTTTRAVVMRALRDTGDSPVILLLFWQRRRFCSTLLAGDAPPGQALQGGLEAVRLLIFVHRIVGFWGGPWLWRLGQGRRLAQRALHEFHPGDRVSAQISIDALREG